MKTVFILQGEHPFVPGRVMSAHSTRERAEAQGLTLANCILRDEDQPEVKTLAEFQKLTLTRMTRTDTDVWVTELPIDVWVTELPIDVEI